MLSPIIIIFITLTLEDHFCGSESYETTSFA